MKASSGLSSFMMDQFFRGTQKRIRNHVLISLEAKDDEAAIFINELPSEPTEVVWSNTWDKLIESATKTSKLEWLRASQNIPRIILGQSISVSGHIVRAIL